MHPLLKFDKMVTPSIIQVIYFLGLILVVVSGIWLLAEGSIVRGILTIIFGAIMVRVNCELLILLFRIYDRLGEINDSLKGREPPAF